MQTVIEKERPLPGIALREMDDRVGGGVPAGSLLLTEGRYDGTESQVARYLLYSALRSGQRSVYCTFQNTVKGILESCDSLGAPVEDYFLLGRVRIHPLTTCAHSISAGESLRALLDHMRSIPDDFQYITVDSITHLMADADDATVIDFFSRCKEMCAEGRTINLVVHSRSLDGQMFLRARAFCDGYLRLRLKAVDERLVKTLEVLTSTAECRTGV